MRVYKDVRFSKDKMPQTNVGYSFRHEWVKMFHAPSFYLHVSQMKYIIGVSTLASPSWGVKAIPWIYRKKTRDLIQDAYWTSTLYEYFDIWRRQV